MERINRMNMALAGFRSQILLDDLHEELTGALVGLARVLSNHEKTEKTAPLLLESLYTLYKAEDEFAGWVEPEDERALRLKDLIARIRKEKYTISPDCAVCQTPCGNTDDYDLNIMKLGDSGLFGRKLHILQIAKELAKTFAEGGYPLPDGLVLYLLKALYAIAEEWDDELFVDIIVEGEGYLERLK